MLLDRNTFGAGKTFDLRPSKGKLIFEIFLFNSYSGKHFFFLEKSNLLYDSIFLELKLGINNKYLKIFFN